MTLDNMQIKSIEELKEKGWNSKVVAAKLKIPLETVNEEFIKIATKKSF